MTPQSVNGRSLESTEARPFSPTAVPSLSPKSTFGGLKSVTEPCSLAHTRICKFAFASLKQVRELLELRGSPGKMTSVSACTKFSLGTNCSPRQSFSLRICISSTRTNSGERSGTSSNWLRSSPLPFSGTSCTTPVTRWVLHLASARLSDYDSPEASLMHPASLGRLYSRGRSLE